MERSRILDEIARYCRAAGMAESTFGRMAVNDGKLVGRIRDGGRISAKTLGRIRSYMAGNPGAQRALLVASDQPVSEQPAAEAVVLQPSAEALPRVRRVETAPRPGGTWGPTDPESDTNFRFFDNRQKYLLFVNTCSEKWVASNRVALELAHIHPRPPAVRVFDAGVGDGTVLARLMRAMHHRFPTTPFYVVGKEVSLEDIRLTLDKMPDRFFEHPASVLVLTNLYYGEAPWLTTRSTKAAGSFVWKECALQGNSAHDFEQQITALQPFLAENWQARIGANGNPVYDRPVALVLYREDHKFLLDPIIPKLGAARAEFDLVVASQPYRARASAEFKAKKVVAPLARALGPGGRLIGIHSRGEDPGMEMIRKVWPDDNPFRTTRHDILKAVKQELGADARELSFNAYSDKRSIFRYDMHTLPSEVTSSIGTSTLFAAWNAAVYVAQVEDGRLEEATLDGRYLDAARDVLRERGGLWFFDESYVISRRRD
ncbi:hypothetical protein [Breoghania sp. L-A4]|uniref:hypothetical protein n=1 Tax=Breoghania sp. L-A4 TaxID=2304600 RepID=UPI000E36099B|nr:hypothetical protein [Breoghania sp. L-A4]AXS40943.1 hypothetical protein D1F64_14035 [Breoghania sp. L-A4]